MKSWIAYGKEKLYFDLPENAEIVEVALSHHEPSEAPEVIINTALENPIGAFKIEDIVKKGHKICIISDDITRPTPVGLILDALMPRLLKAGISEEDIFILIALGSHRKMTDEELSAKLGNYALSIKVVQSQFSSDDASIRIGTSTKGNPVLVQKSAMEADIRIGIGNIVPHNTLGWSGGAKIVFPGIADESSVAEFHMQAALHEEALFGTVENPVRHEVESWAKEMGLTFIINTVLSRECKLIDCVAGDYVKAHREGVKKAEKIYGVPIKEKFDIVIADMEPYSFDFWQGTKALNASVKMVKEGGTVIMSGPCEEGVGPHPEYLDFMGMRGLKSPDESAEEDPLAVSVGFMIGKQMKHFDTMMYTEGLTEDELKRAGIKKITDMGKEIEYILKDTQGPVKIALIRDGSEVLPVMKS